MAQKKGNERREILPETGRSERRRDKGGKEKQRADRMGFYRAKNIAVNIACVYVKTRVSAHQYRFKSRADSRKCFFGGGSKYSADDRKTTR